MITLSQLKQICEGWKNLAFTDPEVEKVALPRLGMCAICPMRDNNTCSKMREGKVIKDFTYGKEERKRGDIVIGCNCNLEVKARCLKCQCPLGKWR